MKELTDKKFVSAKTQFEYGNALVRSKYGADINNGIKMFESLCKDDAENKRDYIYYIAVAYTRIKDYPTALKYVKAFLEIEPNNQQVLLLDVSLIIAIISYLTNFNIFKKFRNISKRSKAKNSKEMQLSLEEHYLFWVDY